MRHALRRILWILPTLFLISLGSFWLLSAAGGFEVGQRRDGERSEHPLFGAHSPPRFFNRSPTSVRELSLRVVRSIAADDGDAPAARIELARLGGAALPIVLPELDALEPKGRARVALALAPIGRRMDVGSSDELGNAETAVLFWTRFWQDRAIEFRPAVAKRAVERLAQKSTDGRRDDVRQLDTYALEEIIDAMAPLRDDEDVKRARRLALAASRITELDWKIAPEASRADAREVVLRWQRWWIEHRVDYTRLDGAERLLAMVSETQYGRWATEAGANRLGVTASGRPVLDVMRERAPTTLWLVLVGLSGGYGAGILLGLVGAAWARRSADRLVTPLVVLIAALPTAALASLLAPSPVGSGRRLVAALVMVLVGAAIVSRHQRVAARVALDQEYTRTARAFGAGPWRLARWSFRASSVAALSLLGVDLAGLITTAFVVEHAVGLPGLAAPTLFAVSTRDVAWLMALAIGSALAMSLIQVLADSVLAALDPRVRLGFLRKRGLTE